MTRVTRLIHNAEKYLLISIYPLPTHNFTHKNGVNLDTLPGWPKQLDHNRPARCAGQWYPIDSYPFRSMSIGRPIPGTQLFHNLTLKIQGQDHGWGHSFKSQHVWWVQHSVDSHPFRSMSFGHPIPELRLFKIWPWKSWVNVMGQVTVQSHNVGLASYRPTSLSFHVNQASHSWVTTFQKFDLEN